MDKRDLTGLEIAIIGFSGKFSGCKSIDEYWELLSKGSEGISFYNEEDLAGFGISEQIYKLPNYVNADGELPNKELFDADFWGYTPNEALAMDPQIRIFHESVWEALEVAGYVPNNVKGKVGLYGSASNNFLWQTLMAIDKTNALDSFSKNYITNTEFICSKIAYKLNLKGPVMFIQTACSSSLVAIHTACRALLTGDCDMALAGGVSVSLLDKGGYLYAENMIMSSDGHCRAFDSEADGTVNGEGSGVVVLKKYKKAIEDGDEIYGIIKSTAINNDGNEKVGYTAPSVKGQVDVIKKAIKIANVDPKTISYIETHGTGTKLGDAIELKALNACFDLGNKNKIVIGSVKSNIGHLDAAAGIAGLIKVILMFKNKKIPKTVHYKSFNPELDFAKEKFFVNQDLIDWKTEDGKLLAGLSSFGIGGTNAHIILENYKMEPVVTPSNQTCIIPLSAHTPISLEGNKNKLHSFLLKNPNSSLSAISNTLQSGRYHFSYRESVVASSIKDLQEQLSEKMNTKTHFLGKNNHPKIVFVFPGQGSQYINMGLDLYKHEAVFRQHMDQCLEIMLNLSGIDFKKILYPLDTASVSVAINETENVQPLLFIISYSLSQYLINLGIKPDLLLGHSIGEYVCACISGVIDLKSALEIVIIRGKLMQSAPKGSMISTNISEEEVGNLLTKHPDVCIAAYNSPENTVLSGDKASIDCISDNIISLGYKVRNLHTSHAFHSNMMKCIEDPFKELLLKHEFSKVQIPYISNISGKLLDSGSSIDAQYWIQHTLKPVKFKQGLDNLLKKANCIFIEVGPGISLSNVIRQEINKGIQGVVPTMRHPQTSDDDKITLYNAIGKLWQYGVNFQWSKLYAQSPGKLALPTYSFDYKTYSLDGDPLKNAQKQLSNEDQNEKQKLDNWSYLPIWKRSRLSISNDLLKDKYCLVFCYGTQEERKIIDILSGLYKEVIFVKPGDLYHETDNLNYFINPNLISDYEQLYKSLSENKRNPLHVVHMWSLNNDSSSFEKEQQLGFYSIIRLCKYHDQYYSDSVSNIHVLSSGLHEVIGGEHICASRNTILSACKVVPQEYSHIQIKNIEFSQSERVLDALSTLELEEDLKQVKGSRNISYRNGYRWESDYQQIILPEDLEQNSIFREDGVYMITGGLGGVGLILAKYIASQIKCSLLLIGRTELPEREKWREIIKLDDQNKLAKKIKAIKDIEAQGSKVLYYSCNVNDQVSLLNIITEVEKSYGSLKGVIHAAGIILDNSSLCPIEEISEQICNQQNEPKVEGLNSLAAVLDNKSLDFCLLTSSLSAILGGLGYSAYAAANQYMDSFVLAHKKNKQNWISINWDGWEEEISEYDNLTDRNILPLEGTRIFHRILSLVGKESQVIISTRSLEAKLKKWISLDTNDLSSDSTGKRENYVERSSEMSNYVAPRNREEEIIAHIWEDLFGLKQVSVNDNFFELGGDSLKMIAVSSKIHKETNVKISLSDFFKLQTVEGIASFLQEAKKEKFELVNILDKKEYYPLSPAQKRLYLLQQMDTGSVVYNIPYLIRLNANLNKELIVKAFQQIVNRHESFRTSFRMYGEEPVQIIHDQVDFKVQEFLIEKSEEEQIKTSFIKPFDLSQAPLLRVALVDVKGEESLLMIDVHHIISDGISYEVLEKEFFALCSEKELPPIKLQYKDYSEWQNSLVHQTTIKKQEEYWLNKFDGELPILDLPADYVRPAVQSHEGAIVKFHLNDKEFENLTLFAEENDLTLYMAIYSVFALLLSKLSGGKDDIIIGTPISGRNHTDFESVVGMFVNTLAIRTEIKNDDTIQKFVTRTKQTLLEAYENQDYQFEDLVEKVSIDRDTSRNPLFNVMFNLLSKEKNVEDLFVFDDEGLTHIKGVSKFDLTLIAFDFGNNIGLNIEYCTKLFNPETIERYIRYFKRVVNQIDTKSAFKVSSIEIISEEEKQQILYDFNNTESEYSINKTIHQLFEEEVQNNPENIAVVSQNKEFKYAELNKRANQFAHYLIEKGIGKESIVGIELDSSYEFIVSLLAVLKAGGAYLPIDKNLPVNRKNYIVENSKLKLLIHNNDNCSTIYPDLELANFDKLNIETYQNINPKVEINPSNLAYVIYTSGTSGHPKGTLLEHKGIVSENTFWKEDLQINPLDRCIQYASISFDASVWEICLCLLNGASLYIPDRHVKEDKNLFENYIISNKITVATLPPVFAENLDEESFLNFRLLVTAGSETNSKLIKKFNKYSRYINAYGPTETSVCATYWDTSEYEKTGKIVIGRPIRNLEAYILDSQSNLQGIGMPGELCISGIGLARGYLRLPELTSEKFIANPFKEGERIYRTSDLARWLPDGNIEFLGRIDHQVKIRGFRIELGEIESRLLELDQVKEALVIDRQEENGDKYLCAYIICKSDFSEEDIRSHLLEQLPDYMIPSYFINLQEFPLTRNGKVNRKALPIPEVKAGDDYVAPSNELENSLVEVWSDVLKINKEEIGVDTDFFKIGGHSLKASLLSGKILKELGVEFLLRDVFIYTTIKEQAKQVNSRIKKAFVSITKAKNKDYYQLSSAQRRMFLLQQIDLESTTYNMPNIISLGADIDVLKIEKAFEQLIERHESFRTSFSILGEEPVQYIHANVDFKIEKLSIDKSEKEDVKNKFIKAFDLSQAPLLRICVLKVEDEESLLLVDMHHIISDGVSHSILEKEIMSLYAGQKLIPNKLQYKDFSEWQNSIEHQKKIKEQEAFWIDKFKGEHHVLQLPTDYVRPVLQSNEGATVSFTLSKEETEQIRLIAEENDLTLYMSLLSIFNILLSKLSGQEDIIVGTPIAGRVHPDLENVVGMFVNTIAIRNKVHEDDNLNEFMLEVKKQAIEAFENQGYQFEDLVEKISEDRDISRNPIFDVVFNLLNHKDFVNNISDIDDNILIHQKGISKFDITLTAVDYGERLLLNMEYCTKLFKADTIERFIGYLKQIINQISRKAEFKISEIEIISTEEKQQVLYKFNETEVDYPDQKSIQELFYEQVLKYPNKAALEDEDKIFTYEELDQESNKIANYLKERQIRKEQLIGIMLGRSTNMIIGILGILKSGGAYVPIDPEYPIDRINQLIEDSGIEILITSGSISRESDFKGEIIDIDRKELKELSIQFAIEPSNSSALAYVMYTSGSTGKPKGVEIEHKSVVRLVKNNKFFPFNSEHKILQTGAPVFDATTFEIWGALLNGGMLYIPKNETIISAEKLEECIKGKNITTIWLTSSLFTQLVDLSDEIFDELNFLLVGGDVLSVKHINKIRRRNPKLIIINGYGPTENTTFSTTFNIEKEYNTNIPIGKPISNSIAYIFNSKNKVQPIGVSGELLLGGDGLARDYLNNPKLTSDKFIENPYKKGERLYRTGDIARWLSDGNIEFIGRIDNQVKIRGYRIELGEVEFVINKLDEVRKGFVDVNISKQIVAYVVLEKEVSIDELRQKVSQKLPSYMIPSYFVKLEEFPLTTNGKIDRKALPEPEKNTEEEYIAPRNDLEKKLVDIWSSVLGIENVGINDNFFNLGGDSIKTIQIQARLNKEGYILSVKDIFVNPTISSLVPKISVKTNVICQDFVSGEVKLTPIQQYFFSDKKDINHFNQSVLLRSESRLEEDKVEKMFSKLLQHHDALRIVCTLKNDQYSLYNNAIEDASISLKVYDLRNENNPDERINEYANQIQRSIDIINGPLLKLGLFHLEDSDRLLIVIHHLVVDGISWRILFEDIETLYDQVEKGETLKLPLKSNSFKDWSQKLIEYSESPKLLEEKDYWSEVTNKEIPSLNCDINDENFEDNELEIMHFSLDKDYTSLLLKKTNAVYSTDINDILICGLGDAVKKTFGNEKIMVSLEGHGREEIITDIDISRTLGWFTTIYPIVLDMEYSEDLSMQIKMVKESLHQIPEKGIGYGVLKYLTPKSLREGIQFNKEPQIEFNYLGQFGSDIQQMTQFSIASEKSGDSISPDRKASFDFSFGGMIAEGELTISVRFKKKYYSSKLVSELMINYKESLLRIIDHCINAISSKDKKLINQLIMEDEIVDFSDEITI